jgi:hypothetical protein
MGEAIGQLVPLAVGGLPTPLLDALQGQVWHTLPGAEHSGQSDGIFWLNP